MHRVTWTPGNPGKGWVFPDGTVVAWDVDASGAPQHTDKWAPEDSVRVVLHPDGQADVYGEPQHAMAVLAAIPGVSV